MLTWLRLLQITAYLNTTSASNWPNPWVTYSNTEVHEYDLFTIDVVSRHKDLGIQVTSDIEQVDL